MNYPDALKGVIVAARYIKQKIHHNYADISKDYDGVAQTYDDHYSKCLLSGLRVFSQTASNNLQKNDSLKQCLELAAGTGESTRLLWDIEAIKKCERYVLVDRSKKMLDRNKLKTSQRQETHGKTDYVVSDAIEYLKRQPANSFDAVFCAWGVCYIPASIMKDELSRILRPNGYVGIIENRVGTLRELEKVLLTVVKKHPSMLEKAIPIELPKNSNAISKSYFPRSVETLSTYDGEESVRLYDTDSIMKYIMESGIAAGYVDAISTNKKKYFIDCVADEINDIGAENLPIIHRYSIATGINHQ